MYKEFIKFVALSGGQGIPLKVVRKLKSDCFCSQANLSTIWSFISKHPDPGSFACSVSMYIVKENSYASFGNNIMEYFKKEPELLPLVSFKIDLYTADFDKIQAAWTKLMSKHGELSPEDKDEVEFACTVFPKDQKERKLIWDQHFNQKRNPQVFDIFMANMVKTEIENACICCTTTAVTEARSMMKTMFCSEGHFQKLLDCLKDNVSTLPSFDFVNDCKEQLVRFPGLKPAYKDFLLALMPIDSTWIKFDLVLEQLLELEDEVLPLVVDNYGLKLKSSGFRIFSDRGQPRTVNKLSQIKAKR